MLCSRLPISPGLTYHSGHDDRSKKAEGTVIFGSGYVFVSETGHPIDLNNFRSRVWEPALKKAELKYRYPYQARHSFATKSIREGRDPLWIANQMGTSLEMLFKHYAVYFRRKGSQQSEHKHARIRNRSIGDLSLMSRSLSQPSGCVSSHSYLPW